MLEISTKTWIKHLYLVVQIWLYTQCNADSTPFPSSFDNFEQQLLCLKYHFLLKDLFMPRVYSVQREKNPNFA